MPIANFFILGAPKCGTTSLQSYLDQHPETCFSRYKEPNYFALKGKSLPEKGPVSPQLMQELVYSHSITDFDTYQNQFLHHNNEKILGDASVRYLYTPGTAENIHQVAPNVKMVAVLREPVSRLYSHFCMNKQYQLEPLNLLDAIEAEQERREQRWGWDWHYVNIGLYTEQLKHYFKLFDRQQLKVYLYDDFRENPIGVYQDVCKFLEIDDTFIPDMTKRSKQAYLAKNLMLDRWLHRKNPSRDALKKILPIRTWESMNKTIEQWNSKPIPKISSMEQTTLKPLFKTDIQNLEDLLNRKTGWL